MNFLKLLFLPFFIFIISSCTLEHYQPNKKAKKQEQSGAALSMEQWSWMRSFPNQQVNNKAYSLAFEQKKLHSSVRGPEREQWEALGPKNVGGRTLCVAFDPVNPNLIYAGAASGGLWKSETAGLGVDAWQAIETGHPVLGVGAIAVDPTDGNTIYIGTGEVYNYNVAAPGVINRITRGSYGIGILKSIDGGQTWTKSLDWAYEDMRGVADLKINPENPLQIFAATSHGLYQSEDGGNTWNLSLDVPMVVDLEFKTNDTSVIFATAGNMNSPDADKGIYRSINGGSDWQKLTNGLISNYTGKALLSASVTNPELIMASVADEFTGRGLFQSLDGGDSWTVINQTDVPRYQGWFAHDVEIDPTDVNNVIYVGVEAWQSLNGGSNFTKKGFWNLWEFGQVTVGGPEGPSNYVHADIHQAVFHPLNPSQVFLATDGGIFVSTDSGENWEGRNGGYQSTQFYANFSNSTTDSLFAMGGMQDNATAIFVGDDAWVRVIGGDGMCTAINPNDDNIIFGSYQYLNIARSDNRGGFFNFVPAPWGLEDVVFSAQFELAPSNPNIVYAGAQNLYKSFNSAQDFFPISGGPVDGLNPVHSISIFPTDENFLLVSTAPNLFINNPEPGKVFKSTDGGMSFSFMQGLPNRPVPDLTFDPSNSDIAYVVYSGFGGSHVYKTTDGGATWQDIDGGLLPDVPTNTILVDPMNTEHVYVGNDLGVYVSFDGGINWELYSNGLPDATIVMHLSISLSNRKLRVATHGRGVYQAPLGVGYDPVATHDLESQQLKIKVFPNPAKDYIILQLEREIKADIRVDIWNAAGQRLQEIYEGESSELEAEYRLDLSELPAGAYFIKASAKAENDRIFQAQQTFVKQ